MQVYKGKNHKTTTYGTIGESSLPAKWLLKSVVCGLRATMQTSNDIG